MNGSTELGPPTEMNPSAWDARLAALGGNVLQSWQWGEVKRCYDWQPERILVESDAGTAMAQVLYRGRFGVTVGYIPRGPVIDGDPDRVWPLLRERIDRVARSHRAIMTLVEPNESLGITSSYRAAGVALAPGHQQPGRTVKVPLGTDDAMLAGMKSKTRYKVRLAAKRGVRIEQRGSESIGEFHSILQDTATRNQFAIHTADYYRDVLEILGDQAVLLIALAEDNQIAAALIAAKFNREAIYLYGASSTENRANRASFLLHFATMQWARDHGCDTYDLWGIPEQDPEVVEGASEIEATRGDDWGGLYHFKTGFGGQIVTYPPMFERRHAPVLPALLRRIPGILG